MQPEDPLLLRSRSCRNDQSGGKVTHKHGKHVLQSKGNCHLKRWASVQLIRAGCVFLLFSIMNPSFLSLCPDDNIKKKAVIPTAEYNRPVICQYTYRVSSVSTLLSELLFQTPEKRVHYTVSHHLYQVLINKLLIFCSFFRLALIPELICLFFHTCA